MSTKLGVIESKWHTPINGISRNVTVKSLFDFFSDLHFGNHHSYDYDLVSTYNGLERALDRYAASRSVTTVYMAMHGNSKGLALHSGESVSRTKLRNAIKRATEGNGCKLSGLYIGSCLFVTKNIAEYILTPDSSITWIAGYKSSVEFVHSSSLDLLFFNTLRWVKAENKSYSHRKIIEEVARRMRIEVPGLCNTTDENADDDCGLGLSLYVRRKGRGGGVLDLLRP